MSDMDRISLGNEEFEGHNNAYVLADGDDLALVDTGIATDEVRETLRAGLDERGYEFEDVTSIVVTHFHPDHAGLAGEVQRAGEATVYVHEADAPLVARDAEAVAALERRQRTAFDEWGMPVPAQTALLDFLDAESHVVGEPVEVTPIEDGTTLDVGGWRLETVHAPGHTAGLCWFEIDDRNEAFVGDVALPVYTPNVGGADVRVDRPLETYVDTLLALVDREYDRLWPGHRDPIDDPAERALTILEHHRDRTERVLAVLREHGPADAWTVSTHLFGELEGIHIMHGPGEAYAHLDHLCHEGVVAFEGGRYHLLEESVDLDAIVPTAN